MIWHSKIRTWVLNYLCVTINKDKISYQMSDLINDMSKKTIFTMDADEINSALKSGSIGVCVIGIGRIGLPTALSFAKSGLPTVGLDINQKIIDMINSKDFPLKDEPGYEDIFHSMIEKNKFMATTDPSVAIPNSDIIVLSLPTPMNENNIPDYSALRSVGIQLHEFLSPGSLVIVESTIEPGFAENELIGLMEGDKARLRASENFGLGVCPENANPGEIQNDFSKLPRLVGALDEKTTGIITEVYAHVFGVELIKMSDCKTANAVKLVTNVFRDINIAFVNELALLFEKLGIDIMEVLDAAKKKYNFQAHYPGAGVGGPCLPINSYQILNISKSNDSTLRMISTAREINEGMPNQIVRLLLDGLTEANMAVKGSRISILGVSYKPNVRDTQLTPAQPLIERLRQMDADIKIYDPYFKGENVFGIKSESNLEGALCADAVILVTAHDEFLDLDTAFVASKGVSVLIDSRGMVDIHSANKSGLIYRGIGRGKSR